MDRSMPPPPPRNPKPSSSAAAMPPPPPPKPSQPEPEAASQPDPSAAEGAADPSPSSAMPPPPPPKSSQPALQPENEVASESGALVAGAEGSANPSSGVSESSAEEAGNPSGPSSSDTEMEEAAAPPAERQKQQRLRAPYAIPEWSAAPGHAFFLEVLKDGIIFDKLDVSKKGAYMFGRIDLCDFVLEHQTISRFHAVLQFRNDGKVFLYDLGSTHGSFINKTQIKKKIYTEIHVGDVIRFGQSSRLYIFQGPSELMPPEKDMQKLQDAKVRQDMLDREASLLRAKTQAALAEGISWGMAEDAVEESAEDEADEITWQTYKGQLTDRQEKTRSKIVKRMEKIANMKKEIDAIRVKDISQGGLTQGQQTQIARNEQRISQIMEELDNLEETLNDSIRESLGARSGNANRGRHKANLEEEDEALSDDDEFYDRTKKKSSSQKSNEQQSVETADSLLEKKDSITSDIESKKKLLEEEKHKLAHSDTAGHGDDLDAYMSGLSSQLVHDKITRVQKELCDLQAELDRVVYLLKIADPVGEAARKRDLKPREAKIPASNDKPTPASNKQNKISQATSTVEKLKDSSSNETQTDKPVKLDVSKNPESANKPAFTMPKPQWLGDKRVIEPEENFITEEKEDAEEPDNFVDYKDRKAILSNAGSGKELEDAAPGLILRKRKSVDQSAASGADSSAVESEASAADAVALLLKHKRGLQTSEEMENENELQASKREGKKSKQKRMLGPARPDFLDAGPDYETWVPPEGQTGDGRTALNDRLGY